MTPDLPGGDVNPLAIFGIKIVHVVAGLLGGVVRVLTRPDISWTRRLTTAFAGGLVAGYGTPIATPFAWQYLPDFASERVRYGELEGLVGFVLGMIGLSVADALIRWFRAWRQNPTLPPRFPPQQP